MRSGMEHSMGEDVRLRCPLFLLSEETVGEFENLLRDLRGGGYTPLSLRELFRCRRGLRSWPPRPCAVLFRGVSFAALQGILPLLDRWETPAGLFCRAPYGDEEKEALRSSRWLQFYGEAEADLASLLPDGRNAHIAAFYETPGARIGEWLRERRIWMAVTDGRSMGTVPGGVDLLYALPVHPGNRLPELLARWHRSLTSGPEGQEVGMRLEEPQAASILLPLAERIPVSAFSPAVYLGVLGNTPRVLAGTDWAPVFDPSDGSYRLCPPWDALTEQPLVAACGEDLRRALEEGRYPFLRSRAFPSGQLLLFGYNGEKGLFSGMAASDPDGYIRANFRPHTLETFFRAGDAAGVWSSLAPDPSKLPGSPEQAAAWAEEGMGDLPAEDGLYHGWRASVAFANRLTEGGSASAASLRAFLEERGLNALRLGYLYEREALFAEPSEKYLRLFESEGRPVLQALRGRETPEGALPQTGVLLQRLLNAEELCRRSFSEELARMQALREFQRKKTAK